MTAAGPTWTAEHVLAMCPSASRQAAARGLATPARWTDLGADPLGVWGRCTGTGAEPYETVVDHVHLVFRCSCPARAVPCKHALALALLWVEGQVPTASAPGFAARWLAARASAPAPGEGAQRDGPTTDDEEPGSGPAAPPSPPERDERVDRTIPALAELDRWCTDRIRTGLADPALARYATWDAVAARLVDGRAGGLANRVRRIGALVGARPGWHEHVLAELGVLHLLARGGRHLRDLPEDLADGVAVALGWQVRQADVLAGVPETDDWVVLGRSDALEDRIVVRRTWLWGLTTARWALLLSFAALGRALDDGLVVGTALRADLHRYPGAVALRALVGVIHEPPAPVRGIAGRLPVRSVPEACDDIGRMLALEPWLERVPAIVLAAPARAGRAWVLSDDHGSLPLADPAPELEVLVAASEGRPAPVTIEWTPGGARPLAVHGGDRSLDLAATAVESWR